MYMQSKYCLAGAVAIVMMLRMTEKRPQLTWVVWYISFLASCLAVVGAINIAGMIAPNPVMMLMNTR